VIFLLLIFIATGIMARPQLSGTEKKAVNFTVRITAGELKKLTELSLTCGKPVAALIREKVFRGKFPAPKMSKLDLATYIELKKIGVNLNQLTKLAHTGRINTGLLEPLQQLFRQQEIIINQLIRDDSHSKDR
jgi:hypothetical protein